MLKISWRKPNDTSKRFFACFDANIYIFFGSEVLRITTNIVTAERIGDLSPAVLKDLCTVRLDILRYPSPIRSHELQLLTFPYRGLMNVSCYCGTAPLYFIWQMVIIRLDYKHCITYTLDGFKSDCVNKNKQTTQNFFFINRVMTVIMQTHQIKTTCYQNAFFCQVWVPCREATTGNITWTLEAVKMVVAHSQMQILYGETCKNDVNQR